MPVIEPITARTISEVVDVHMEAFNGYMNASMGREYVRRFVSWFAEREKGIALAAVHDGRVVGYVVGAPIGYERSMNRDLFWIVARSITCRPWLLLQKRFLNRAAQRLLQIISPDRVDRADLPHLPEPVMSLVGIGVSASGRGSGVGRRMMEEFESRCRSMRMKAMRLSVYANNPTARALYEHAGWTLFASNAGAEAVYYYRILEPADTHQ
jgi:ribosomal protein S18 acetylase RimI-like enzyme